MVLALLLLAAPANDDTIVRPLLGVAISESDSGTGFGAQLGVRLSPLLFRGTFDLGSTTTAHGYFMASIRGAWLHDLGPAMLVLGAGFAEVNYGFVLDDPAETAAFLLPEVGVIVGAGNWFGKAMLSVVGFVPLKPLARPSDRLGNQIGPPRVMATLLLAI
jgi:hypothetical protein